MIQADYYIYCDICHDSYPQCEGAGSEAAVLDWAYQRGWKELNGKHLCDECVKKVKLPAPSRATKKKGG